MVFFAQKILRKVPGNWTFVIVTDRVELDEQIAKTFAACGAVSDANVCHAETVADLRELLAGNNRYVFTLIHKFQTPELLCDRRDVIVLTDEAHRTQYDTLALNMRSALPNALFLAFTGTPLIAGEERTREVFGDYVSIYDFQQSVEDGATVPLFYENRTPELHLDNPNLMPRRPRRQRRADRVVHAQVLMVLRNGFHQTTLVPGKEREVLNEVQQSCRITQTPQHHLQRNSPRLVLTLDAFPLGKAIPLRRQRTNPAIRAVGSDQERVVPKQRGDSVLEMLIARQVLIERLPSKHARLLEFNDDKRQPVHEPIRSGRQV
jgi:hypothetical protein